MKFTDSIKEHTSTEPGHSSSGPHTMPQKLDKDKLKSQGEELVRKIAKAISDIDKRMQASPSSALNKLQQIHGELLRRVDTIVKSLSNDSLESHHLDEHIPEHHEDHSNQKIPELLHADAEALHHLSEEALKFSHEWDKLQGKRGNQALAV